MQLNSLRIPVFLLLLFNREYTKRQKQNLETVSAVGPEKKTTSRVKMQPLMTYILSVSKHPL